MSDPTAEVMHAMGLARPEDPIKPADKGWTDQQLEEMEMGGGPWTAQGTARPIVPPPPAGPPDAKTKTVQKRDGKINIGSIGQSRRAINPGDLYYNGDPTRGVEGISIHGDEVTYITYKADDMVALARAIQIQQVRDKVTVDVEELDHLAMAKDLLKPVQDDGVVQILDGTSHPDFSLFPGNSAESLRITIGYIETQHLQETAPWSAIWNLWQCLKALSHDQTIVQ